MFPGMIWAHHPHKHLWGLKHIRMCPDFYQDLVDCLLDKTLTPGEALAAHDAYKANPMTIMRVAASKSAGGSSGGGASSKVRVGSPCHASSHAMAIFFYH
jgi:hypothetical protein